MEENDCVDSFWKLFKANIINVKILIDNILIRYIAIFICSQYLI